MAWSRPGAGSGGSPARAATREKSRERATSSRPSTDRPVDDHLVDAGEGRRRGLLHHQRPAALLDVADLGEAWRARRCRGCVVLVRSCDLPARNVADDAPSSTGVGAAVRPEDRSRCRSIRKMPTPSSPPPRTPSPAGSKRSSASTMSCGPPGAPRLGSGDARMATRERRQLAREATNRRRSPAARLRLLERAVFIAWFCTSARRFSGRQALPVQVEDAEGAEDRGCRAGSSGDTASTQGSRSRASRRRRAAEEAEPLPNCASWWRTSGQIGVDLLRERLRLGRQVVPLVVGSAPSWSLPEERRAARRSRG